MKKITFLLALLITMFSLSMQGQMLFDYETTGTSGGFASWGGAGFAQITNPYSSGINTSTKVGQFTHDGGGGYIGIQSDGPLTNFDFAATPYFRIKVWVDKPVEIIFKLQNDPDWNQQAEIKYQVSQEETNKWIQLVFNFGAITSATNFNRVVLYFDGSNSIPSGAGHKYYFDDIEKSNVPPAANVTYSPIKNAVDIDTYTKCTVTSNFKLRNIDNSAITDIASKVWLKQGSASGTDVPFEASLSSDLTKITISPKDLLNPSTTYFYGVKDNVIEHQTDQAIVGISASFTTKNTSPIIELYGDFDGTSKFKTVEGLGDPAGVTEVVDDPSGATNKVLKWNKGGTWGGWERIHFELEKPVVIDAQNNIFSVKVYSPSATPINSMMLKLSDGRLDNEETASARMEQWKDLSKKDGWETIYFKLGPDSNGLYNAVNYTHLFIFAGSNDITLYVDEIKGPGLDYSSTDTDSDGVFDDKDNCVNTANANQADMDSDGIGDVCDTDIDGDGILNDVDNCPEYPNTDQADDDNDGIGNYCDSDYVWTNRVVADYESINVTFEGWNGSAFKKIANPKSGGINVSNNVAEFSHSGNDWWSGLASQALPYTFNFTQTPFVRMKVYSESPIFILFKLENDADSGINAEVGYQMTTEETGKWTEIVFNFSGVDKTNLNKIVLFIDPGKSFSEAGTKYYFDDITVNNIAPPVVIGYSPNNEATNVELFGNIKINSNYALQLIGGGEITDISTNLWLKKASISGADIPFTAKLSDDKKSITIIPNELLEIGTTYYYGINLNEIEYAGIGTPANNVSASYTTRIENPVLEMYNNFDGTFLTNLVESMEETPAENVTEVNDPLNASNKVLQWNKGGTWSGWERIHMVLTRPIDLSGNKIYSLKILAPKTGYVRLKIANQKDENGAVAFESDANFTKPNEWQTLYFKLNITNTEVEYNHLFIYIDGGSTDEVTYYIDEVEGPALKEAIADADGDGVADGSDNCVGIANANQADFDNDGIGDVCDNDIDGDGVINSMDNCNDTPNGATVDVNGCTVLVLSPNNFTITTTGESCKDKANGKLQITASETYDYKISIDGGTSQSFTNNSFTKENMAGGKSYEICITITDKNYKQCFTIQIDKGGTISGKASVSSGKVSINITEGTAPFNVFVNETMVLNTSESSFEILAKHGDEIKVKSAIGCEGVFSKTVEAFDTFVVYPNPTKGAFNISLPIIEKEVSIEIYSIQSQLISVKKYPIIYGKVNLDLNNKPSGLYYVKVNLDKPVIFKIIKQ